jgi:hypothetical protein
MSVDGTWLLHRRMAERPGQAHPASPLSTMACTNGRAMMMANAKSIVTPVKELARRPHTYRRAFRGVHKPYLHRYVTTYEA